MAEEEALNRHKTGITLILVVIIIIEPRPQTSVIKSPTLQALQALQALKTKPPPSNHLLPLLFRVPVAVDPLCISPGASPHL